MGPFTESFLLRLISKASPQLALVQEILAQLPTDTVIGARPEPNGGQTFVRVAPNVNTIIYLFNSKIYYELFGIIEKPAQSK